MAEKSIDDIYRDIENEVEEDCFDREDIRLKDQDTLCHGRQINEWQYTIKSWR